LNSLFDREIKVYYGTQVLKKGINIKTNLETHRAFNWPEFWRMEITSVVIVTFTWVQVWKLKKA